MESSSVTMANRKFQLDQRISTSIGDGVIATMPYNETTDVYGVWLDKPYINDDGVNEGQWIPVPEKYITAI